MTKRNIIYIIIAAALLAIWIFKSAEIAFIQKTFIVQFHKSGMVGDYFTISKLNGEFDTYLNGKISLMTSLKNGELDGWQVYYFPDGLIKKKFFVKNNKKEGIEYSYYEDGKIEIKESFKNGQREGPKITYFRNGQVEQRLLHKKNKVEGKEYAYYEDGNLKYTRNWLNGKYYGDFFYYYKDKSVEVYHAFDILGDKFFIRRYDSSGKVSKDIGGVFSDHTYTTIKDSVIVLKTGDTYKSIKDFYVTLAYPPIVGGKITILINKKDRDDLVMVDNNTLVIKNAFDHIGTYHIAIDARLVEGGYITARTTGNLTIIRE